MAMVKSKKFPGVYANALKNGDVAYFCGYNDITGAWKKVKIGMKSHGITENYTNGKRIEFINMTRLGEDPLAHKKNRQLLRFSVIAENYFTYLKDEGKKDTYNPENRYKLHIKKHIGTKSISHITKADIIDIKKRMLTTHSKATVRHVITLISTIFNHAITSKTIRFNTKNVCEGLLDDMKLDNQRMRYLSQKMVEELLEAVKRDVEVDLFTRLSLSTGGRLKTILNLKAKDISNSNITLYDFKSKKSYTSFLSEALFNNFANLTDGLDPNDYVIGRGQEIYSSRKIQRRLKKTLDQLFNNGLDVSDAKNRIVVHSLRHSFASLLVIAGTPIYNVMKLMNHSSIDMTMRYAHLSPDSGKNAINNLFTPHV